MLMELRGLLTGIIFMKYLQFKCFLKQIFFISSSCHICTAGDDHQALIWDIQQMPRPIEDPILAYTAAEGEVVSLITLIIINHTYFV